MKDIAIYFTQVKEEICSGDDHKSSWRNNLVIYKDRLLDLEGVKVALFGVNETRGSSRSIKNVDSDAIRKQLYNLEWHDHFPEIADLGDIVIGKEIEDTYFAIESVVEYLVQNEIIPFIIGGSQDLTFSQYRAYSNLEQLVNLVNIDYKIDIGEINEGVSSDNFLTSIITHQPNFLFNYSNIGHQVYFNKQEKLQIMDKMFFETLRLGELNANIHFTEPLIRNADILSIDLRSIRSESMPIANYPMPNGISGKEICQMAWYAGMSDKLTSIGIYEYNELIDNNGVGAMLVSQIIWYFIEGFSQRKEDFPKSSTRNYIKYTIHLNDNEHELIFYKSPKSDRWWVEVPYPDGKEAKYFRHLIVPCTYEDYQNASNGEMPDIWWETFQKLI